MSSAFRSTSDSQAGQAAPPLLLAAPIVGLVVSLGVDWLASEPAPRPAGEWPLIALLVGMLVVTAAVAAAVWTRREGRLGVGEGGAGGRVAAVLSALLAAGAALFVARLQGPFDWAPDTVPIVAVILGLLVALFGLVVLFTVLRRRSQ